MRARHAKVTRDSKPECSGLLKFSAIAPSRRFGLRQASLKPLGLTSALPQFVADLAQQQDVFRSCHNLWRWV